MADATQLAERVALLEARLGEFEKLPARMDALESQFVQFRLEMREEFSAFRREIRLELRHFGQELRQEMQALNAETRRHMLVLHEQVIEAIRTLGRG